ncbi:hypothetical protein HPB49_020837 [Dermacentor silvarum]|uniref:Uncharacterized protein n=1 Tax=Dermacentor silvarum TaxID=543639 RepID=A0ACB8CMF1_DERSI|nr:hypothetical protein HPB49_020837 [Dermacentor silvarum]
MFCAPPCFIPQFLGFTEVEQSKGIEVVREGIRKLKFNQQLKRSEGGKVPKVELTISVDGVAVQDPKTKRIFHQHPLHRISYCADDKTDKKSFSFIAKESDGERHSCFVFSSEKLRKRLRKAIYVDVKDALLKWFVDAGTRNIPISTPVMLGKAKNFAFLLDFPDFSPGSGWLHRFKVWHGIVFKSIVGEASSTSDQDVATWLVTN